MMKWVNTKALILFAMLSLAAPSFAEEKEPWGFQYIAVINLPTNQVSIHQALDQKAIEMKFLTWSPQIEETIKNSLSESPLRYRLFPSRQSAMFVEVYSTTAEVDFAVRTQRGGMQVFVGEVRKDVAVSKLLNMDNSTDPIPDIASLVLTGQYAFAKQEMYIRKKNSTDNDYLFNVRVALIDHLRKNHGPSLCSIITGVSPEKDADIEAIILDAWCEKKHKNIDAALQYTDLVKKMRPAGVYRAYAETLEKAIVSDRILTANRLHNNLSAAVYSVKYSDIIKNWLAEVSFIETVASTLIDFNLAGPLAKILQGIMARDISDHTVVLEPVLVESYIANNKTVLAMDYATYFLSKRQPAWNVARLKRGLGYALLQSGDWAGAEKALSIAKTMGVTWGIDDALALLEAQVRSRKPAEILNASLDNFNASDYKLKEYQTTWVSRLQAEINLRAGKKISKEALGMLPDYTLYEGAAQFKVAGQQENYSEVLKEIATRNSGWGKLAKVSMEIEKMEQEANEIKAIMEKIQ